MFVEKSELRLWRGLHLWKNRFTFVGVLRWWAGLRLTALQGTFEFLASRLLSSRVKERALEGGSTE